MSDWGPFNKFFSPKLHFFRYWLATLIAMILFPHLYSQLAFCGPANQENTEVALPAVENKKGNPVGEEILDLGNTAFDVDNLRRMKIEGADRRPRKFNIEEKKGQNKTWVISHGTKKIGEVTLRGGKLFFRWASAGIAPDIIKQLRHHVLVLRSVDNGLNINFKKTAAGKKIAGRHHGLDASQVAPENVTHLYPVDLAPEDKIKLVLKSPFLGDGLMRKPEKQRTRLGSRKLVFKREINKNIAVAFNWTARVKQGKGAAGDMLQVNQKITYDLGGGKKDLPLNVPRVVNHRNKLKQQIEADKFRFKKLNKDLLAKQKKVRAVDSFDPELAFQVKLGNEIKALRGQIKNTNKRIKNAEKHLAAIQFLLLHLEDLEDQPYPYQVSTGNAIVAESGIWNHTAEDCVPLLGKWETLGGDHLTVKLHSISTTESGKPWHHDVVRLRFVGPCSTDSNDLEAFGDTGNYVAVAFGLLPTKLHPQRIVRREFVIDKNNMDAAEETRYEILEGSLEFMQKKHAGWNRLGPKVQWHRKKP